MERSLTGHAVPNRHSFIKIRLPFGYQPGFSAPRPRCCAGGKKETPTNPSTTTMTTMASTPKRVPCESPLSQPIHHPSPSSKETQTSSPPLSSPWPRQSALRVCRMCGGRRVIRGTSGLVPCPACVSWRQRPDYVTGRQLMSERDLNFGSLSSASPGTSQSSQNIPQPTAFKDSAASKPTRNEGLINASGSESDASNDSILERDDDSSFSSKKAKKRRANPMTEQRRLAIKAAMQNRGPLSPDHRRKIADALAAKHRADPGLAKRPKRCSHCGKEGHNRMTCPELNCGQPKGRKNDELDAVIGKLTPRRKRGKTRVCGLCGEPGHNKRSCPMNGGRSISPQTKREAFVSQKMIIMERTDNDSNNDNDADDAEASDNNNKRNYLRNDRTEVDVARGASSEDGVSAIPDGGGSGGEKDARAAEIAAQNTDDVDNSKDGNNPQSEIGNNNAVPIPTGSAAEVTSPSSSSSSSPLSKKPRSKASTKPNEALVSTYPLRTLPGANLSLTPEGILVFPLPSSPEECVTQACGAVLRAWRDGIRRQALELLLPQPNAAVDDGWPGGIRQQFRAALPMVEGLLLRLKRADGLQGRITAEWLDEGDCVGAWQSEKLATVVFPTAEVLPAVRRVDDALSGRRLMLVINPQWQPQGNVVSDFGFGSSRRAAERFVGSLEDIYYLRRIRVLGDEVRVLRSYPGQWQVYYVRAAGETELVSIESEKPTYQRLLELLKNVRDSQASQSWLDRVLSKNAWREVAPYAEGSSDEASHGEEVDAWDGDGVERDIVTGEVLEDYQV